MIEESSTVLNGAYLQVVPVIVLYPWWVSVMGTDKPSSLIIPLQLSLAHHQAQGD